MLGIAGRTAVTATQYLAFVQQRLTHELAGAGDRFCQLSFGSLFGSNTFREVFANASLHVHTVSMLRVGRRL